MSHRKVVKVEKSHGAAVPVAAAVLLLGFWLTGGVGVVLLGAVVAAYVVTAALTGPKSRKPGKVVIEDDPLL